MYFTQLPRFVGVVESLRRLRLMRFDARAMFRQRHRFLRLAFLPAFAFTLSAPALADECDRLPAPSVTVKRIDEPIKVDTQYGFRQLTHLGSDIGRAGHVIVGLTRGKARARFSVVMSRHVDRSRRWECSSPHITVTYGFSPMIVYVAKEIPQGTCAYDEVFRHEMLHVNASQEHIAALEQKLRDALAARFVTGQPWRGPVGQAPRLLQRELVDLWQPYLEREINLGMEAQKAIDSPEEYARVMNSCEGEIGRLTKTQK